MSVDELAARRRAVAERMFNKQCERDLERLRQVAAVDHVAQRIASSLRRHPSGPRPYDHEVDG